VTSADLLLHPVRLRIVQAFLGDRALTTTELRAELPDVPQASLYRNIARLVGAGVLSIVSDGASGVRWSAPTCCASPPRPLALTSSKR